MVYLQAEYQEVGLLGFVISTDIYAQEVVVISVLRVDPIGPALVLLAGDAVYALCAGPMIPIQAFPILRECRQHDERLRYL